VDGPHGWDLAAVNLGRLEVASQPAPGDVPWGTRRVLPLIEARLPVVLEQMELDAVSRGAKDADLKPLEEAARKAALFEETTIYRGLQPGHISGILEQPERKTIPLPKDVLELPRAVAQGVQALQSRGIPGPFFLLLGKELFLDLMAHGEGDYPPHRVIRELVEGGIRPSPAVQGGLLMSGADGHFELTIGQDWSIGYAMHDRDSVELYLTESFTFRVLEPSAAVELTGEA
jgi:uncharacterized linocin/CFP29 family protein